MLTFEYVTETKPREWFYPERHFPLPRVEPPPENRTSEEFKTWRERNEWLLNFTVHVSSAQEARELARNLWSLYRAGDGKEVERLLTELRALALPPFEKRVPLERWAFSAVQVPRDIGGPNKKKIRELLSSRCRGRVLEAMCGFNSYLDPSPDRKVVALDFCREALERYPHPERTRILFDLNLVTGSDRMEFFREESFDAVTVCFGFNYPHHPVSLFREFRRILSPHGALFLVENPAHGYWDLARRRFSPGLCRRFLRSAGFSEIRIERLPIAEEWERQSGNHRYFLVEAMKG